VCVAISLAVACELQLLRGGALLQASLRPAVQEDGESGQELRRYDDNPVLLIPLRYIHRDPVVLEPD
jgi:hypothetical protein